MKNMAISYMAAANSIIGTPAIPSGYVQPASAAARIAAGFQIVFVFVAIMSVFFIIKGGLDYITSGGDPGKVKAGMGTIQNAVIGLVVAFISFTVVRLVATQLLGIPDSQLNFPI